MIEVISSECNEDFYRKIEKFLNALLTFNRIISRKNEVVNTVSLLQLFYRVDCNSCECIFNRNYHKSCLCLSVDVFIQFVLKD